MGGGSSSSNSSSVNNTEIDNSNTSFADIDGGLVLNLDGASNSNATIIQNTLDGEVVDSALDSVDTTVDRAFDFGSSGLSIIADATEDAFNFGQVTQQQTQDFATDVIQESREISNDALNKVAGVISENTLGDAERTRQIIITIIAGVTILGAVAAITFALRR